MSPLWTQAEFVPVVCAGGRPASFRWEQHPHAVTQVSRHWRVHLDWWTPAELWRDYWELATDGGLLCVLYCDLLTEEWYLERVYA
jgi:hypothetical protein